MKRIVIVFLASAIAAAAAVPAADSVRGAKVFETQLCGECHALNGVGPKIGPDLGKLVDRGFTPASLSSKMWNHAPAMWSAIEERKMKPPGLDEQDAADLFAFFYSTRFFEEPGDAARGKRFFDTKSCSICHGITEARDPAAKPVIKFEAVTDPIAMIEAMWNHAANMRDEMARRKIPWPELSGQDIADILVYLRNLPSDSPRRPGVFRTTSGSRGKELFDAKGCAQCHRSAEQFLGTGLPGQTLTDVAAEMWDHASPREGGGMAAAKIHFEPGEMREIASFIWSQRMFENSGNPARGKNVFKAKGCAGCHDNPSSGAPSLTSGEREFSDISMMSVLWEHGPAMLGRMKEKVIPWPHLDVKEMADLIAYLNSRAAPVAR